MYNRFDAGFLLGLFFDPEVKIEATYSSETSLNFQWNTLRYVPEDTNVEEIYMFSDISIVCGR
jgi:hypothetical protein